MKFSDLNNRHAGDPIWIIGTGPGLDSVPVDEITGPRILINRAAFVTPDSHGESYWLVVDDAWTAQQPGPWTGYLDGISAGSIGLTGVFRTPLLAGKNGVKNPAAPMGDNIVHFDGESDDAGRLMQTRDEIAVSGRLFQQFGTGATAAHLAWYLGASRVILAGLDGTPGHAKRLEHLYDNRRGSDVAYAMAGNCLKRTLKALNLPSEERRAVTA